MFRKKSVLFALLGCFSLFSVWYYVYPVGYYLLEPSSISLVQNINQGSRPYKDTGVFIINLDRSTDRYARILPKIEQLKLPYQRISAIDGNNLSENEIKQKVDFETYKLCLGHLPKRGTIGCSLSHIKAWKTFLESSYQYAFIIEDDIFFEPFHVSVLIKNITQAIGGWDLVSFELHGSENCFPLQKIQGKDKLVLYFRKITHSGAYLITRNAAEKLLSKALPIKMPVDHYFTRGWELDLAFMGIKPRPVVQHQLDLDNPSMITCTSDDYSFPIENDPYRFYKKMYLDQTSLIRLFYNLKLYIRNKFNNLLHDRDWSF